MLNSDIRLIQKHTFVFSNSGNPDETALYLYEPSPRDFHFLLTS